MKLWLKFTIGTIIGLILGAYLPISEGSFSVLEFLYKGIVNLGMYALFPLVFFSLGIGLQELAKDKKRFQVSLRSAAYIVIGSVLFTAIGIATVLLFPPDRIPITRENPVGYSVITFSDYIFNTLPENSFSVFTGKTSFLFPIYLFGFILGLNFNFDKVVARPVIQFFDSFSRILFNLNKILIEILSIGLIVFAIYFLFQIRNNEKISLYLDLFTLLLGLSLFLIVGVLPLLLYLLTNRENPYKLLLGSISTILISFFSGNNLLSLASFSRTSRSNLGIPRKSAAISAPLFAMFGRGGTALVTSISFIFVIRSYTSLGIDFISVLWIGAFSTLLSFITHAVPAAGAFTAVAVMCGMYGGGMLENGYLILKPALPLLISFSALLDAALMIFGSVLVSRHTGCVEDVEIKDFN